MPEKGGDSNMSAFMVTDETINRVVNWLEQEVYKSSCLREQAEKALSIPASSVGWAETVGKAMFQLNVDGVEERYGVGEAKSLRELDYTYVPMYFTTFYNHNAKIQVLKSMQCWLYQCMEGEVVDKPLYQLFRDVIEPHLMSSIITDLPEYDDAKWG